MMTYPVELEMIKLLVAKVMIYLPAASGLTLFTVELATMGPEADNEVEPREMTESAAKRAWLAKLNKPWGRNGVVRGQVSRGS